MTMTGLLPILRVNFRSLRYRLFALAVLVVGTACVVGSFVALIGVGEGLTRMVVSGGSPLRALVLSNGARSEMSSTLSPDDVAVVSAAAAIARDATGQALASADTVSIVDVRANDGQVAQTTLRGTSSVRGELYPHLRIVSGRTNKPGLRELLVGRSLLRQLPFLSVGQSVTIRGTIWRVTGVFALDGGLSENTLMTDVVTAQSVARRQTYQSVTVKVTSPEKLQALRAALTQNPALSVDVIVETDYLASAGAQLRRVLDFLAYFVGTIMAAGAICSAFTIFYVTMENRQRELATLQAIGFGWLPALVALLCEAMLIGLAGAVLGSLVAYLSFNDRSITTMGVSFDSVITFRAIVGGVLMAVLIDLLGALVPALRAARRPLPELLNST